MDKIAKRMKAYIDTHPFDPGDSDVKLCWINSTKPTQNPMNPILQRSAMDSKSWISFWKDYPWMITMPYGTSVAKVAPLTNIKLLSMDCYMVCS